MYKYDNCDPDMAIVRENNRLNINSAYRHCQSHISNGLRILGAAYGLADVTHKVRSLVRNNRLAVAASNGVFGDSYYGVRKTLVIVYQFGNGPYRTFITTEGSSAFII